MLPIGWLLGNFGVASGLGSQLPLLIIGASNSPLSGVGTLVVIGAGARGLRAGRSGVTDAAVWLGGGVFKAAAVALYRWLNRVSGPVANGRAATRA